MRLSTKILVPSILLCVGAWLGIKFLHQKCQDASDILIEGRLAQVKLALDNYMSANGKWPPLIVYSENGSALHSWRSLLSISEDSNESNINILERWDSNGNSAFRNNSFALWYLPGTLFRPELHIVAIVPDKKYLMNSSKLMEEKGLPWAVVAVPISRRSWMEPGDLSATEFSAIVEKELAAGHEVYFLSRARDIGKVTARGPLLYVRDGRVGEWLSRPSI